MTALHRLEAYLGALDRRLRIFAASRGLAICVVSALLLTIVFTWTGNHYRFAADIVLPLRITLFFGVACAFVFGLIWPFARVNRRSTVRLAESHANEFGERLLTLAERKDSSNPFNELLAEDALRIAESHPPQRFVPSNWLIASAAAGVAALGVLIWLVTSAPGYWGYGASLLWTSAPRAMQPLYEIYVLPGNSTVRRRSDQVITAKLKGFSAPNVILHAKYHDALKWNTLPMQAQPSGSGYQLLFTSLSDSLEYFIEAGGSESKRYTIAVKDLPAVKHLRVAVHFPSGLGLPDSVEDPGGDVRAVEGSTAEIRVLTDKPLQRGVLVLDNGTQLPLTAEPGNWLVATVPIKTDGSYHVAALDNSDVVRMTGNYVIEARKDEAPTVSIVRPGRDAGVSAIEELPVAVAASDDFGLRAVELHYSVNGAPEQVKTLQKSSNAKQVDGKSLLTLEDYKLQPGDLVSMYATATDATHLSRSDIVFAKVEPFDLKFRQSQQVGGGGGGAGEQGTQISERQKEIIAATWNQLKDPAKESAAIAQNAHFLSDLEAKLGDQAKALSQRMDSRELGGTSPQFEDFSKSMVEASSEMSQAVDQLKPGKWTAALPPEQKALKSLLRAESLFRDIQVSFGQQAGGGGRGGMAQERDLARMFDLELDTAKNQYETGQSPSQSGGDAQKKLDQQLEKLKEMARRQQQMANAQHSPQQQFQQKWEEEQLRREAEQLRQQLQQQLTQNSQSGSPSSSSQSSQSQSSSSQNSSNGSSQQSQNSTGRLNSAQQDTLRQAIESLSKAEEEMRRSASQQDSGAQQRAANKLAEAQQMVRNMLKQQASSRLADLADKAKQLSASQQDLSRRIKSLYGAEGINTARTSEDGSVQMPEMNGPGYGGWYRRRVEPRPDHPASPEEKSLADENEKLAEQVKDLQDQLQKQAQAIAPQQPEATRQIRKALSEAEQAELAERMRKNSDWMRRGFGSQTWPLEDSISAATQRLSRQVDEAAQTVAKGQEAAGQDKENGLSQALSQVRSLREQLEAQAQRAQQGSQGQTGQGSPSAQSGERGQTGQQSQSGQEGQQGSRQQSSNASTDNRGNNNTVGMYGGEPGGQQDSSLAQLNGLRARLGRDDRQLNGYFNEAMGALRRVQGQDGLLDARLENNALISLQRLEVELAHRVGQNAGARTGSPGDVPEGYRDAVATYFRTLSK